MLKKLKTKWCERKSYMNKTLSIVTGISNMLMISMPIVMLALFISKISGLSCIDVTNKAYILLGCLAIITYWCVESVKRGER